MQLVAPLADTVKLLLSTCVMMAACIDTLLVAHSISCTVGMKPRLCSIFTGPFVRSTCKGSAGAFCSMLSSAKLSGQLPMIGTTLHHPVHVHCECEATYRIDRFE